MSGTDKVQALSLEIRAQLIRSQRTPADLARALGISQTQTSARLRGQIVWRVDELWTVAELCQMPATELIAAAEAFAPADEPAARSA